MDIVSYFFPKMRSRVKKRLISRLTSNISVPSSIAYQVNLFSFQQGTRRQQANWLKRMCQRWNTISTHYCCFWKRMIFITLVTERRREKTWENEFSRKYWGLRKAHAESSDIKCERKAVTLYFNQKVLLILEFSYWSI